MVIAFSRHQMAQSNAIAIEQWFAELHDFLHRSFPSVDKDHLLQLCALYRTTCARLGIQSEHGLYAFHILCLSAGHLISSEPDYIAQHIAYEKKYGSADALPIDLLAQVKACGA